MKIGVKEGPVFSTMLCYMAAAGTAEDRGGQQQQEQLQEQLQCRSSSCFRERGLFPVIDGQRRDGR